MRNPIFNRGVFVFSLLGAIIAGYLWYMHGHAADIPCGPSHGCETVALSPYSRFPFHTGPPVAAWGTFGYLGLAVLAFLRTASDSPKRDSVLLNLIVFGATLGTAASLYFTSLEFGPIHAFCRWCIGSQIIMLIIFFLSWADRLMARPRLKGDTSL